VNILLLTEAWPPAPMVGSHRAAKVGHALCRAGHTVLVATSHGGGPATRPDTGPGQIVIERLEQGRNPREFVNAMIARLGKVLDRNGAQPEASVGPDAETVQPVHSPPQGVLRRTLIGLLWLPDDQQSFIPAAYRVGRRLHRERRIDMIYSTAPAFSVHVAAMLLERAIGCRWIAEFRDPWTDNAAERLASRSSLTRAADRALERAVLTRADAIVTNSERAAELFRGRVGPDRSKSVLCAINGIPRIRTTRAQSAGRSLRIVYAGNLYPPRDPFPLLRALGELRQRPSSPPFEVIFVGHCAQYGDQDVARVVQEMGIADLVRIIPYLPAAEAQNLVDTADLLLLPAQGWSRQIPNKLFDYLGSRVPILAIVEPGSETAAMLDSAGGHFIVPADRPDDVLDTVDGALQVAAKREVAGSFDVLHRWSVEPQMTALVSRIEQLLSTP
jgi:glycosyltransferase involved in cell wall biosynthesis